MISRAFNGLACVLALSSAIAVLAAGSAIAQEQFDGGSITDRWENDAGTEAGFGNLHYEFDGCGEYANELTCVWSIKVVLHTGPIVNCPPVAPEETVVWDSGERSGNGEVDSGPQSIPFPPCQTHQLTVDQRFKKTFGPWEGEDPPPLLIGGGGSSIPLLPVNLVSKTIQNIVDSSPAATPEPPPAPQPRLRIGSDCRSLYFGATRYAFRFRRLGCWKASRLVQRAWSGTAPRSYRCVVRRQGRSGRCAKRKNPKKFFAWHPPRRRGRS